LTATQVAKNLLDADVMNFGGVSGELVLNFLDIAS
jgi:hypothetical protein